MAQNGQLFLLQKQQQVVIIIPRPERQASSQAAAFPLETRLQVTNYHPLLLSSKKGSSNDVQLTDRAARKFRKKGSVKSPKFSADSAELNQ